MGYTFSCDVCGDFVDHAPPFMGEFRESWLKTADSPLTERYQPGQTVTICRPCIEAQLNDKESAAAVASQSDFESSGHET